MRKRLHIIYFNMHVCHRKLSYLWFSLLLIAFLHGCDQVDRRLTIVNKTSKAVFFVLSKDSILDENNPNYKKQIYTISNKADTHWTTQDYFVKPKSEKQSEILGINGWTSFINQDCQDSTLYVFVFDAVDFSNNSWEGVKNKNLYRARLPLKVEDLEKIYWKVVIKD